MGKIKKIIHIIEISFSKRDYGRFGIDLLRKNGYEVEVWNLISFLHSDFSHLDKYPDYTFDGYKTFNNFTEIQSAINKLDDSCFIIFFSWYRLETYKIYRLISKKQIRYAVYVAGSSYPFPSMEKPALNGNIVKRILRKVKSEIKLLPSRNFTSIKRFIFRLTPNRFLGIKPAELVLAGAKKINFYNYPIEPQTEILWIHYWDYDIYLKEIKNVISGNGRIGVFLDEYFPFHPDWDYCNVPCPIGPEEYFSLLRKFFDYVEKTLGIKIVIAAHPRADYEKHPDYFEGRPIFRGQTANLVRKSKIVLSHTSYAVNYAVLFNKPVIFMTSDNLDNSVWRQEMDAVAGALDKKAINLDQPYDFDWENELSIDEITYKRYKNYHIKIDGTPEMPFWQVVSDKLKLL